MRNIIKLVCCVVAGWYVADATGILDAMLALSDSLKLVQTTLSK